MAYVVFFGALAVWRWHVWSYGEDTGGFTQMVLNTFHGFYNRMESRSHFGAHWSPILATLWPIVAVSTHEQWYSEFAGRYAALSPNVDPASEYLVYGIDFNNPVFAQKTLPALRSLLATKQYVIICRFGNVVTYRRLGRR